MIDEQKANSNFYRFDNLTIDCKNFCLQKAGENISLTPRAFDVLIFLIKNQGRIVEKQELFETIWKDTFVSDNALTKIIKEIRRAIGDDATEPLYIETVPKRGYRFIAVTQNGNEIEIISETCATEKNEKKTLKKNSGFKKLLVAGAVCLGLVVSVLGFIVLSELRAEIIAKTTPIDSIAVLPFETDLENAELENVSDRLTENLINAFSRSSNLRVMPRSIVFNYKNKREDAYTVGRGLRVRSVLSGKIVRQGDNLVTQVELIDVDRKAQLWGQQYNLPITEADKLSEEISRSVLAYFADSADALSENRQKSTTNFQILN